MNIILLGALTGFMLFSSIVLLLFKMPEYLQELVFGHYLIADIAATSFGLSLLPVVGIITLFTSLSFFLFFTLFLGYMRRTRPYRRLELLPKIRIVRYEPS